MIRHSHRSRLTRIARGRSRNTLKDILLLSKSNQNDNLKARRAEGKLFNETPRRSVLRRHNQTIDELQKNWIWAPNWVDSSQENTAGRVVKFTRRFDLSTTPEQALLHFSADTRYKLYINGIRIAVGPTRGSPLIWYYDTLNIAPYLRQGSNEIEFAVVRYFATVRGAMPFGRTSFPGLTVVGAIETPEATIDLNSREGWSVCVDNSIRFPMGLVDDVFLHVRYCHLLFA